MTDDWIGVGEPIPRLKSARALEPFRVAVEWENGDMAVIDLRPLIQSHQAFHLPMEEEVLAGAPITTFLSDATVLSMFHLKDRWKKKMAATGVAAIRSQERM